MFIVVVTGGPRLGDIYAGFVATALALWAPPLFGGLLIISLLAVLARLRSSRGTRFMDYDDRTPQP